MSPKQRRPKTDLSQADTVVIDSDGRPVKPSWWQVHHHWHHFSRRSKIISTIFLGLFIGTIVVIILLSTNAWAPGGGEGKKGKAAITSPLTGLPVKKAADAKRPVTGIMIENSLDARPQAGLRDAGVVFEAIAEGGITRFIALYQEAQPQYIGPVRSLRPYYIDWANSFDASIAHVGGSPKALTRIRKDGKDLDQFFNSGAYWRVAGRPAPHNVYTSFKNLDKLNSSKGYKHSNFTPWPRKAEAPAKPATVSKISLLISGPEFDVGYVYDSKLNAYRRSEGGATHLSMSTSNPKSVDQITPKVVIAMVVGYAIDADGHHSDYDTIGKGLAYIFQDGTAKKVSWSKKGRYDPIVFSDSQGNAVQLDAGQTWVTAVDAKKDVRFKELVPKSKS